MNFKRLPALPRVLSDLAFVATYVVLDWASYLHPLHGLNITPWNPSLALGLVYWFRRGTQAAVAWFIAILISEIVVRGLPSTLPIALLLSGVLTAGYGAMAELLRRQVAAQVLRDSRHLLSWLLIVCVGTLMTSALFIALLYGADLIPIADWDVAFARFWIGDAVGIVVTMPFFWLLINDRNRLRTLLPHWETLGYNALAVITLWISFGLGGAGEFQYFYLLFLPLVWAAARQGVAGAAIAAFVLQAGIIIAVHWHNMVAVTVFELQMLGAVLAFVGLFIGAVVDEKQRLGHELRQTLRLAAAGEMAAALAHELNQPLTALSAYGHACQQLLEQKSPTERLANTVERMVAESHRAAEVVRRLRDFFRTGATQLEKISLADLIHTAAAPFASKAQAQQVDLTIDIAATAQLLGDRLQLEVVLRNLLANAFDAVAEQPIGQRSVHIHTDVMDGRHIGVRITDSGPGVSPQISAALFEPFQTSKAHGLGLGLTISRAIAHAHGGDLIAQAAHGGERSHGGAFLLTLPLEHH